MNKSSALVFVLVFLTASFLVSHLSVKADSKTIVVPDDYSTIQEAIDAANEGDTVFVKEGNYQEETLEISKSISLVGEDVEKTEIDFVPPLVDKQILGAIIEVRSTAFSINADNVRISGLTLKTKVYVPYYDMVAFSANGDRIEIIDNIWGKDFGSTLKGDQLRVAGNFLLRGMQVHGSNHTITGNVMSGFASYGNGSRISENMFNGSLTIMGAFNLIRENSCSTMRLWDADSNLITNNTFSFLHVGYDDRACSNNTISANSIVGPGDFGILMSAGSNNVFHDNLIYNYTDGLGVAIGGRGLVAENNVFYRNIFVNNDLHVSSHWEVLGAGNFWDNGEEGNFWDDYTGVDRNMDGIGDVPYAVEGFKREYKVGEVDEFVSFVFGVDHYPLMFPTSIEDFSVELPEEIQLPTPYPESTPTSPTSIPSEETQQLSQEVILGLAITVAVLAACIGLLIYFIKRK